MTISDLSEAIAAEVDDSRDNLFSLCEALVASDSTNPPGTTAGVAKTVSAWLTQEGVPLEVIKSDDSAPNIVSAVVGARPGKHVVFNAHMDTMEAGDETLWTDPPLKFVRRGGRAYGLGMGNMKGALAGMCLATALLHRRRESLAGRLSLTAVSDEVMFGSRGTVFLLDQRPDLKGDFLSVERARVSCTWRSPRRACSGSTSKPTERAATHREHGPERRRRSPWHLF
jgi:succinyl-diaminopimelate desuccinylase